MMSDLVDYILTHDEPFKSKSRLTSLYSDFSRLKSSNPDGYNANVAAWTAALTRASEAGVLQATGCAAGFLSFRTGPNLEARLECRGVGRPVALGAVVDEAVAKRELISADDFLAAKTSVLHGKSWRHFELPTAWQVAQWGLRQVGLVGTGASKLADAEFVVLSNLEAAAEKLLTRLADNPPSTPTSHVHSLQTFTQEYATLLSPSAKHTLTTSDLKLLLTYLSRDKNIITLSPQPSSPSQITIKLPASSTATADAITPNDHTTAHLRTLHQTLTTQTTLLTTRIQSLDQTARNAVSSTSSSTQPTVSAKTPPAAPNTLSTAAKSRALAALRQKQLATATLAKRAASLAQIDNVLASIDDAASHAEIVAALAASTAVLRDLNAQIGGAERVADVVDKLHDATADVEDVGRIIAEGGAGAVDEGEVDEEFEALEREERRMGEEREQELLKARLPDAPVAEVGVSERVKSDVEEEEEVEKRLSSMSLEEGDGSGGGRSPQVPARIAERAEQGSG